MQTILFHATTVAVLAVAVVLLLGLRSLLKSGSENLSQQLMRWRIGLQAIAIAIIALYGLLQRHPV